VKTHQKIRYLCFSAQLIASAFGAPVYRYVSETGWHELATVPERRGAFVQDSRKKFMSSSFMATRLPPRMAENATVPVNW
jgi:GMP synthase-like glutamine amidotransferase